MRQIVHLAAFWVVVIVAIRLAVCFPQSLLAQVFFSRIGPIRERDESEPHYLLRWACFGTSWFMQAALLFVVGWAALQVDASLFESLVFAVLWVVVGPLFAAGALLVVLLALARLAWVHHLNRETVTLRQVQVHEHQR